MISYEQLCRRLLAVYDAGEARAIVRYILQKRFGLSHADILCGKVTQLSADDQDSLEKMMLRMEKAEPVQYVLGTADFCGRPFGVNPDVLIPRVETEELCRWIVEEVSGGRLGGKVEGLPFNILDIGTGSGCIAITLALELSGSSVTAWDLSDGALQTARDNAGRLGAGVVFERRDALKAAVGALPVSPWSVIVSNPPYICTGEREAMSRNVLDYEPHQALFAPDEAPDVFYRRIGDYARRTLCPGGGLYFELNPLTARQVSDYLRQLGFLDIEMRRDQFGKQRMMKAIQP